MRFNMKIGDLFDVAYGQKEYHTKRGLKGGRTLLISSQGTDNGCYGFFNIVPKYIPPIITIPSTGSIGYAFVQTEPCCVDDNCLVLVPKKHVIMEYLFYVCSLIKNQKWRFMYGRQITPYRIKKVEIDDEFIAEINFNETHRKLLPSQRDTIKLEMPKLKKFRIGDILKIEKGEGVYFENLEKGSTPLISAKSGNNGVIGYVNIAPTEKAPAITVERILGTANVQQYDFATVPDDIYVMKLMGEPSVEVLVYLSIIINYHSWRYNYSRKVTPYRLGKTEIELPVDNKGDLDINYMKEIVNKCYGSEKLGFE